MVINDFQNGGRPQSWIFEIGSFCHVAFDGLPFCFLVHLELKFFLILDYPRGRLCGSIVLLKFVVDPIFALIDTAILRFCQLGWKMPNHAPFFGGFLGLNPLKLCIAIKTPRWHGTSLSEDAFKPQTVKIRGVRAGC